MTLTSATSAVPNEDQLISPSRLAAWLGKVVDVCIVISVLLVPLFFLPFTLDVLELNKQTLLAMVMGVGVLAWLGQALSTKVLTLSRSWLHVVVIVFILGYGVISLFSQDRYLSIVGNFGQMQWSFITLLSFVLFYGLVVNTVKGTSKLYRLVLAFLASSTLVGVLGLLQLVGIFPLGWLGEFARVKNFNTIGTINSLGIYMTLPLILAASLTVLGCKDSTCVLGKEGKRSLAAKGLVWVSLAISLIIAIVVDYWVIWAAILFGTALLVVIPTIRARTFERSLALFVPGTLMVLSIVLLLFKTPFNLGLPSEVAPSASASWSIARQTLQDRPLFGSGPGTWIFDYSKYRQVAINASPFWTVRFERGLTAFLTLIAMIGLIGMALWVILIVSSVIKSASHLILERNDDSWQAYLTVFTAWATSVFIAFVYNYNFSHHFAFWFFLALLAALLGRRTVVWDVRKSTGSSALLSVVFLAVCVAMISGIWLAGQRLVADTKYAQAVALFKQGKPIQESIAALQAAVTLNKWNDSYYRNLAQAHLVQAGQGLQSAPEAERTKQINASVTAAVDLARRATEVSPANVDNWANFALVLQSITSFTRGADEQAIRMFQEAIAREPNNPVFSTEIGKLHILRSDAYRQLAQSTDVTVRKDAEQNVTIELDKAAQALNQAIQTKSDYAPAHYSLGLVYERQGRVQDAIAKLEQVLSVDSKDVGIAFQLAILYYRNNEKDKSLNVFEQIVAFDQDYANARWYLSSIYEERGRYNDAIAQIRKVQELNPANQAVADRLKNLISARDAKVPPKPPTVLPEPVKEEVKSSVEQNPVQTP